MVLYKYSMCVCITIIYRCRNVNRMSITEHVCNVIIIIIIIIIILSCSKNVVLLY